MTTQQPPPPPLPPIEGEDLNLISSGVLTFGYILASIGILTSISLCAWTIYNRRKPFVRASQPLFLCQLCIGTLLIASAIIPFSFPGSSSEWGPDRGLDAACMSVVWLVAIGFVLTISALLAKTWRLIKLMNSGRRMRRVNIDAKDVMLPFTALMVINVSLLLCITLITPFSYERVEVANYDSLGRSLESYGTCNYVSPTDSRFWGFATPLFVVDFGAILIGIYQCYVTREMAWEISESYYLTLSMGSLFETLCLGGPLLAVVSGNPTAGFVVGSSLICVSCMTVLLPIFQPKFATLARRDASVVRAMGRHTAAVSTAHHGTRRPSGTSLFGSIESGSEFSDQLFREGLMPVYRPDRPSAETKGSNISDDVLRGVSGLDLSHPTHSGAYSVNSTRR